MSGTPRASSTTLVAKRLESMPHPPDQARHHVAIEGLNGDDRRRQSVQPGIGQRPFGQPRPRRHNTTVSSKRGFHQQRLDARQVTAAVHVVDDQHRCGSRRMSRTSSGGEMNSYRQNRRQEVLTGHRDREARLAHTARTLEHHDAWRARTRAPRPRRIASISSSRPTISASKPGTVRKVMRAKTSLVSRDLGLSGSTFSSNSATQRSDGSFSAVANCVRPTPRASRSVLARAPSVARSRLRWRSHS